jgi:hypothetical protein
MKTRCLITFPAFALAFLVTGQMALAQVNDETVQSIRAPNKVETSRGVLDFTDGGPFTALARSERLLNGLHSAAADHALLPLRDSRVARFSFPEASLFGLDDRENRQTVRAGGPIRLAQAPSAAPPSSSAPSSKMNEQDQVAEALANPLSYLWLVFIQNDTIWYDGDIADDLGEDAKVQNTLLIQPVLSFQLTENWKTILRPVIPINSFETVGNVDISTTTPAGVTGVDFDRKTGLGDIVLWTAFSNQYTPPYIWGFGPTMMLNTATDDQLGTGKWSAGPMGIGMFISEKWILGGVAQHWWSFAGEDTIKVNTSLGKVRADRPDVSLTDFQPIIRYRVNNKTNIGLAPNWRYNWETDQLSLPLGMGADTLIYMGPLPVKVGLEAYYYVERDDDFGPKFQFRLLFVPVLPAPEWSRTPIF